jgi:serralysin
MRRKPAILKQLATRIFTPARRGSRAAAPRLGAEQLGERIVPAAPRVIDSQVYGAISGTFDTVQVRFDQSMLRGTFTPSDVTLTGPDGPIAVQTTDAVEGSDEIFLVTFAPQSAIGTYTAVIGPDIQNTSHEAMSEDGNGTPGQATDAFTTSATLGQPATLSVGGSDGSVRVVNAVTSGILLDFRPLDANGVPYQGVVETALGDLNGDEIADLFVAAASPAGSDGLDAGKAGRVFVFDGADIANGQPPALIHTFTPFANTDGPAGSTGDYVNGVNIAAGDVNGDGKAELIAGTRGGSAAAGNAEFGRLAVVVAGAAADGSGDSLLAPVVTPFGEAYQKGVVVAAGDMDGDHRCEIAVTRGGPVAQSNPNKTAKLKAFKFVGGALAELNLSGQTDGGGNPVAFAPFAAVTGAGGSVIERDARVTFVDQNGDGHAELVFSALDPLTDPTNTRVRIGVYSVSTDTGLASLVSTGPGTTPSTYLVGDHVTDHAIAHADLSQAGITVNRIALVTEAATPGVDYLVPLTGQAVLGHLNLNVLNGGVTLDGN